MENEKLIENQEQYLILEALRERRRLPELADFQAFKQEQLKLFTSLIEPMEELIYRPDDSTIRQVLSPHPFGGLIFIFEDVTDQVTLFKFAPVSDAEPVTGKPPSRQRK